MNFIDGLDFSGRGEMLGGMFVRRILLQKPFRPSILRNRVAVLAGSCFSTTTSRLADLKLELKRGYPVISIPLPTTGEVCEFTVQSNHSIKSFLDNIKEEDEGVEDALIQSMDGNRVAQSTRLNAVLTERFNLKINDQSFTVQPSPEVTAIVNEDSLEHIRSLVEKLYTSLDVGGEKTAAENQLTEELEKIHSELEPLEEQRQELEKSVESRTNAIVWGGMAFMAIQFGFLARLTWWEYSWDIMEPVTYFVTYATSMAMYAYFVLTRQEYMFPEARNRQFLITFHKKAKRHGFDVEKYNSLRDAVAKIEEQLEQLNQPTKSTSSQ